MLRGEADCAVHSLKDVPMQVDAPFALPAFLARADHADAFISSQFATFDALPPGACVGTSSLRRQAQLRALRPDLEIRDLRGNVKPRWPAGRRRVRRDHPSLRGLRAGSGGESGPPGAQSLAARAAPGRDRDRMLETMPW